MLQSIESASGVSQSDLRYRLAGPGFGVLRPQKSGPALTDCLTEMGAFGMPAMVVKKTGPYDVKLPPQAKRVCLTEKSIEFQTAEEEPILLVDNSTRLLVIVTDLSGQAVKQLLTTIAYTSQLQDFPFEEVLKKLSMAQGAALLYDMQKNPAQGVFIDSGAFTFLGLNDALTPSASQNFRVMIDAAMRLARTSATDHYFGISALPGAKPDWGGSAMTLHRRLAVYAHYMLGACRKGLFQTPPAASRDSEKSEGAPAPDSEAHDEKRKHADNEFHGLEPPPSVEEKSWLHSLLGGSVEEALGGLVGILAIFFFVAAGIEGFAGHPRLWQTIVGITITIGGGGLFCYALTLLYYKRMVENTPTSKVRSLSMGITELSGRTRPYYDLRTAHTLTRCVFYECRYYRYKRTQDGNSWQLTRTVTSGKLPFFLEDDTGQVLINPKGAYYSITRASQTMRGRLIPSLAIKLEDPNLRVTEDLIPIGAKIYILGSAHLQRQGKRHRERLTDRLRAVKKDASRMAQYDQNGDGHIDTQEWDAARADMERQVYAESLAADRHPGETVVVEKPRFGFLPFIVADSEEGLLKKLALRSWLFLGFGVVALACGIGILL